MESISAREASSSTTRTRPRAEWSALTLIPVIVPQTGNRRRFGHSRFTVAPPAPVIHSAYDDPTRARPSSRSVAGRRRTAHRRDGGDRVTLGMWVQVATLLVALTGFYAALQRQIGTLRTEVKGDIAGLRTELKSDMADLRTELKSDMAELRTELKSDMGELRTELKSDMGELRTELKSDMADLRTELKSDMGDLRTELRTDLTDVRTELRAEIVGGQAEAKSDNISLRADLKADITRLDTASTPWPPASSH
jgi:hypothetical protein